MPETVRQSGDFGVIHKINDLVAREGVQNPSITIGIGDDTACFQSHAGYEMLVTCDCMVEGRHYLTRHIGPFDLGRRAMVLNISDIGAMGGHPLYALVSLGLKRETTVADVEEMYRGFLMELNPFGGSIIGGNLTRSQDADFIDITIIGEAEQGRIVRRSTAREGDAILVTGYPGCAAAGLQILLSAQPGDYFSGHPLVHAYNVPSHRAREGEAIARSGHASAMIDISDGFLGDLGHICEESVVGALLFEEKFPISEDLRQVAPGLGRDPNDFFLKDSDDYELIITCPADNINDIRSIVESISHVPVSEVGSITGKSGISIIKADGTKKGIIPGGWDHFIN